MTNTNNTEKALPRLKNTGFVRGIFVDADVKFGQKSANNKVFAQGWIKIKVGESIHQIRVFQMKMMKDFKTKEDTLNKNYTALDTFLTKHKSIADVNTKLDNLMSTGLTQEQAQAELDKDGFKPAIVEAAVELGVYDALNDEGEFDKQYRNLQARWVRSAKDQTAEHQATFTLEAVFLGSRLETKYVDGEEQETGRTIASIYLLDDYRNFAKKTGVVVRPAIDGDDIFVAQDYFDSDFEQGQVFQIMGTIEDSKIETVTEIAIGFGKKQQKVETQFVNEWAVDSVSEPFTAEMYEIAPEALVEAQKNYIADCQTRHAEKKSKGNQGAGASSGAKTGFGAGASKPNSSPFGGSGTAPSEGSGMSRDVAKDLMAKKMLDF